MNQEVAKTASKAVNKAVNTSVMEMSFGADNLISQDIRLPKILLMQSTSTFVKDKKAVSGDIVESFEVRKLGNRENPVQIIPFYFTNTWTVKKKDAKGKFQFYKIDERGGSDIKREYLGLEIDELTGEKNEVSNHKTLNIFCLIKGGNLSIPYMISMYNSSFKYGAQPFINKTQILKAEGKAPAHLTWLLSHTDVSNEDGDRWLAFSLEAMKDKDAKDVANTQEEVQFAFAAYKSLTASLSSGAKVDMTDVESETVPF